jgi:hypothetical protein
LRDAMSFHQDLGLGPFTRAGRSEQYQFHRRPHGDTSELQLFNARRGQWGRL